MPDLLSERLLDPGAIDIDTRQLLVINDCETPVDQIILCFPFSTPNQWISLRDATGKEIGLLETTTGMTDRARQLLEAELKNRYHIPEIQRIHRVESGTRGAIWHVDTTDGPTTFTLRSDRGLDISAFPRIFLTDGQTRKRYVIGDFTALDKSSQKLARTHLSLGSHGGRGGGRFR